MAGGSEVAGERLRRAAFGTNIPSGEAKYPRFPDFPISGQRVQIEPNLLVYIHLVRDPFAPHAPKYSPPISSPLEAVDRSFREERCQAEVAAHASNQPSVRLDRVEWDKRRQRAIGGCADPHSAHRPNSPSICPSWQLREAEKEFGAELRHQLEVLFCKCGDASMERTQIN